MNHTAGMALAVKKGTLPIEKVPKGVREHVASMAKDMDERALTGMRQGTSSLQARASMSRSRQRKVRSI